ncbi:MAG TPA: FAD-dependent oxidoreductase [Dehalococcoidales bacterium]|nr:FAD-dependent oxidoreductase [Dehalococcoidales bacterium]
MFDYDAVIIGGGPAGLTAAIYLARANLRTLLLEEESFGGKIKNVEWIENYPGFAEGISGPQLANRMESQALKFGLKTEIASVTGLEIFSRSRWVACSDGRGYTAGAVIIAGGSKPRKLNVPGEAELTGKGVFTCAFCDGGQFAGKVVAVAGGGDSGVTEALYMSKIASRILLFEAMPALTATAVLQDRIRQNPQISFRCGARITSVSGQGKLENIQIETSGGLKETVQVDGLLVQIGMDASTDYLGDIIELDSKRMITVSLQMETSVPGIFAAGDIRSGSTGQVAGAVGDGTLAAMSAIRFLQSKE